MTLGTVFVIFCMCIFETPLLKNYFTEFKETWYICALGYPAQIECWDFICEKTWLLLLDIEYRGQKAVFCNYLQNRYRSQHSVRVILFNMIRWTYAEMFKTIRQPI